MEKKGTRQKSAEQRRLDALMRDYINSDPELRRFYRKKAQIADRRARRAFAACACPVRDTWQQKAGQLAGMVAGSFATVALIVGLLCLA